MDDRVLKGGHDIVHLCCSRSYRYHIGEYSVKVLNAPPRDAHAFRSLQPNSNIITYYTPVPNAVLDGGRETQV